MESSNDEKVKKKVLIIKKELKTWIQKRNRFLALYNSRKENYLIYSDIELSGLLECDSLCRTCFIIVDRKKRKYGPNTDFFLGFNDFNSPVWGSSHKDCVCFRNFFDALNVINFLNYTHNCESERKLKIYSLKEFGDEFKIRNSNGGYIYEKKIRPLVF